MKFRQIFSFASTFAILLLVFWSLLKRPQSGHEELESTSGQFAEGKIVSGFDRHSAEASKAPELDRKSARNMPMKVLPRTAQQDALEAAVRDQLAWMDGQLAAVPPADLPKMKPIEAREIPADLLPKYAPLRPEQVAALGDLRWNTAGKFVDYRTAPENPTISYLKGRQLERAAEESELGRSLEETTARQFLRKNDELLLLANTDENLVLRSEQTDDLGYTQMRFATAYEGLPIWPSELMVQTDPNGHVSLMTGSYAPSPEGIDTKPAVTAAQARVLARQEAGVSPLNPIYSEALEIYAPVEQSDAKLAWRFEVESSLTEHWNVFVDAQTGALLHKENCVCTAHVVGSGQDIAGNTRSVDLWSHTDGNFYMVDTTKPMYNAAASQPPNPNEITGGIVVMRAPEATVSNGQLQDLGTVRVSASGSATSGFSPASIAASHNLSIVYDYYLDRFGRNSIDGNGGSLLAIVDVPNYTNASWNSSAGVMLYGNGAPFAQALDVTSHEMTHGVITSSSDLVYRDQPGALNESYSDVLGEGCEAHILGRPTDWTLGDVLPQAFHRSFSNPSALVDGITNQPYPERMSQYRDLPSDVDQGGVHVNSSIHNHAFYQLAVGLPGAIGIDDALAIFYRAVTTKLNPNSQFIDSRLACITSAEELFGNGSAQAVATGEAFDFVEIYDQNGTAGETPIPVVNASDSTLFTFLSYGQTYLGRREEALNDGASGVFLGDGGVGTLAAPNKKPSVIGDGSMAIYITPNFDAATINTMTGEENFFGLANQIESVSASADGSTLAFVLRETGQPGKTLFIFDVVNDSSVMIEATQPTHDEPGNGNSGGILLVDALDLSPDGRFVYYDALNRINIGTGNFSLDTWSTYFIDLNAEQIFELFPPLPGFNIGNPSLGQVRSHLLTFDVANSFGTNWIYATNRETGVVNQIAQLAGGAPIAPGWPGFSGDDSAIVYTDYFFNGFYTDSVLAIIPLAADGVTSAGTNTAWLAGATPNLGTLYRRGEWQGLPTVSASAIANAEEGGASGCFRITREVARNVPLSVSFTLVGSARNGIDFTALPLTATIPAGATFVDVTLEPIDDEENENEEQVTLNLSDLIDYRISQETALVTISDNDSSSSGFASWALSNGVSVNDPDGNPDRDAWTNLEEYALGLNPQQVDGEGVISVRVTGNRMVVDVIRLRRSDITYAIETSDSLRSNSWTTSGTTVLSDTDSLLSVRHDSVIGARRFARLRVSNQ